MMQTTREQGQRPRLQDVRDAAPVPVLLEIRGESRLGPEPGSEAFYLVATPDLGEHLICQGVANHRILNAGQGSAEEWRQAIARASDHRVADGGLLPPRPYTTDLRCLVILPTYNERTNLAEMVQAISRHIRCDLLVVDDNSPDGTGEIADELALEHDFVHVLHRPGKLGLGTAYIAGFRWGLERGYERLVEMDCDFSHDPRDLPRLVHASLTADLVIGSRYVSGGCTDGWVLRRRLLSRGANLYTKMFLGASVHDWTAGFRCYKAEALARLDLRRITASGYSFQIQMAWIVKKSGGKIREIPIHFTDRDRGESKMDSAIAMEALRLVPALRFRS